MEVQRWTQRRVLDLAPDQASIRSARRLAAAQQASGGPWSQTGTAGDLVFGRCQGSGAMPYQVTADLSGPNLRCTCPSRKQPCKHALALLLLWSAGQLTPDPSGAPPPSRPTRPRPAAPASPDPHAAADRRKRRLRLMDDGLDELERWLQDLIRDGLAAARHRPYGFWDAAAARLVDAQVPRIAERIRQTPTLLAQQSRAGTAGGDAATAWADALLGEIGRWHLAATAWRRRDDLPAAQAADVRTALGWARRDAEVRQGERVEDRWVILGVRRSDSGRVTEQRTWVVGRRSGTLGVLLDFAGAGATLATPQTVGSVVAAEMAVYPGAEPTRLKLPEDAVTVGRVGTVPGATTLAAALHDARAALAANPFRASALLRLAHARTVRRDADDDLRLIVDDAHVMRVVDTDAWTALALTGGRDCQVVAELLGDRVRLLAAAVDGMLVPLGPERVTEEPWPSWREEDPRPIGTTVDNAAGLRAVPGWSDLVAHATLGTLRLPHAHTSPERAVLDDAATLGAAGRLAATVRAVSDAPADAADDLAPPPHHSTAPDRAVRLLDLLLGPGPIDRRDRPSLLAAWITAAARAGARIPAALLPRTLEALPPPRASGPATRRSTWRPRPLAPDPIAVAAAVDAPGRWLARRNSAWTWAALHDPAAVADISALVRRSIDHWRPDRLADAVGALRRLAPADTAATDRREAWAAARTAEVRIMLLRACAPTLTAADGAWMDEVASTDDAAPVRAIAATLLARLPASHRATEMRHLLLGARQRGVGPLGSLGDPDALADAARHHSRPALAIDDPMEGRPPPLIAPGWGLRDDIVTGAPLAAWASGPDAAAPHDVCAAADLHLLAALVTAAVEQDDGGWCTALLTRLTERTDVDETLLGASARQVPERRLIAARDAVAVLVGRLLTGSAAPLAAGTARALIGWALAVANPGAAMRATAPVVAARVPADAAPLLREDLAAHEGYRGRDDTAVVAATTRARHLLTLRIEITEAFA